MNSTDTYRKIETASDGTVTVTARRGNAWVQHFSAHRGGALFIGQVELRELGTGRRARISVTSIATDTDGHIDYLFSLWDRHLGAPKWWTDSGHSAADYHAVLRLASAAMRAAAARPRR